jgi:succinate dehydrogenase / fumarate reductase membrane anchor subunit
MDMVTAVTNLGRSGLSDWLVQRLSAVVLLAYTLCLGSFIVCNPDVSYEQWQGLFQTTPMRVFSMLALLSLVAHAWIGLWAVSTDYLIERVLYIKLGAGIAAKANLLRGLFQIACGLVVFTYLIWGIEIFWG